MRAVAYRSHGPFGARDPLKMSTPTDLDAPCGAHFSYRDLIACGETCVRLLAESDRPRPFDNLPREAETFAAMRALCAAVLDPAVNHFGAIELTYGFASAQLTREIKAHIHPPLDQHAGHELNRAGKPICPRLGLAVDFLVPNVDSRLVARWVVETTAFDRLYFYKPDRPLHVSVGPDNTRQIVDMREGPSGRRVPRVLTPQAFLDLVAHTDPR
jgi:hypothetical protein